MKLFQLAIYKWNEENSIELVRFEQLADFSFFHRGPIREHLRFHSRLIASRTGVGRRTSIENDNPPGTVHSWVHPQGLGAVVVCDQEYPMRVAFGLLDQAIRVFLEKFVGQWEAATADLALPSPELEELFTKFQNPTEADKLTKIEKDLDEVKGVVMQSMDDLLKRGESLDGLMQKSQDLSNTSVQFYRTAKKNNQCCKMY